MKVVETSLIENKKHNHYTRCHSNGKTNDINERENLVLPQVSPRDFEIIFDHGFKFCLSIVNCQLSIQLSANRELFTIHNSQFTTSFGSQWLCRVHNYSFYCLETSSYIQSPISKATTMPSA